MAYVIRGLYTLTLLGLALCAGQAVVLMVLYLHHRRDPGPGAPSAAEEDLPIVTVQVPLRNEQHVAHQIIRAVAAFDWPRDRLEIQVLDDSDDETAALVSAEVSRLQQAGVDIVEIRRERPRGYKAGALAEGLSRAKGDFVAVFDADFCPAADFLRETVPHMLSDPDTGFVQARWTHLNAAYSLMTRIQALALDAHFTVEHLARNRSGLLVNANGSAVVWRRAAIEDVGGWSSDTVTEDLDLSYRMQLAGWRARYLPNVVAPAELTPLVTAFKAQQRRWAKGASQCLRKLARPILRSRLLNPWQKVMGLLHLTGYFNQPLLLMMVLLMLPMVLVDARFADFGLWLGALAWVPPVLYLLGQVHLYRDWPRRILAYPALMLLWLGMAWSLTLGLVDGLRHWGGTFVRTPKYRIQGRAGRWQSSSYRPQAGLTWVGELVMGVYVCCATWLALVRDQAHLVSLVAGYAVGQTMVLGLTLAQALAARGAR